MLVSLEGKLISEVSPNINLVLTHTYIYIYIYIYIFSCFNLYSMFYLQVCHHFICFAIFRANTVRFFY
jgi:hypothetical protein